MNAFPLEHGLFFTATLFAIGLVGLLVRRNVLFVLICIEILLNAAGFAFVIGGAYWSAPEGQVMFLFVLSVAAAEVAVGLALVLRLQRAKKTLDLETVRPPME